MKISKTIVGESSLFLLDGRLDTITSAHVQEELLSFINSPGSSNHIVLDFAKLTYLSSAGMRVLLIAQKAAAAKKKLVTLCNISDGIRELLDLVGFLNIFPVQEPPNS